jgi:LysR family transcriptional regulator, glycine cleavage system transcriptional activator
VNPTGFHGSFPEIYSTYIALSMALVTNDIFDTIDLVKLFYYLLGNVIVCLMATTNIPLTAVRAFCAAAEHLSFKDAAQSMHVTPGAISQQVKQLEDWFGLKLFERKVRGVALTEAGTQFFLASQKALRQLNQAAEAIRPEEKIVRLTTVPTLAFRWMVPRLAAFSKLHPMIEVSIDASLDLVDLDNGAFDLAIRAISNPSPDLNAVKLFDETWWPVCSPNYKKTYVKAGTILADARLLHEVNLTRTKELWQRWQQTHETSMSINKKTSGTRKGAFFSHEMLAYQAAIQGQGIALANKPLIESELNEQRLVIALNKPLHTGRAYYLLWSKKSVRQNNRSVEIFRRWILDSPS